MPTSDVTQHTSTMLDYRKFPPEIRLQILPHLLELQPTKAASAILIALGTLAKEGEEAKFYAEAQQLYRQINAVLTLKNQKEFQKAKMLDLMKIRSIKLVMQPMVEELTSPPTSAFLRNNFATLIFDCSLPNTEDYWIQITKSLSGASLSGVCKVIAILSPVVYTINPVLQRSLPTPGERTTMIERADKVMGVKGTRVMFDGKEMWTWERGDGDILDCGLPARGRGRDTSDIGVGASEGLKRFPSMSRALAMLEGRK